MNRRNYPRVKNSANEPRDRRIYEQCVAGVPYAEIIAELQANAHGWKRISSGQGIRSAALRYAERNRLPAPTQRS